MDESPHEAEKIERLRRAMYSRQLADKLKPRDRRELEPTRKIVGEDFMPEEPQLSGTIVPPRTIGMMRKVLWGILALTGVFFVAAVGFFIFYFTLGNGGLPASPSNIDIAISGPPEVSGGQATQMQIIVTNRNKVPLELADLVLKYPPGTRSPADFTTDLPSQRISLGTIEPGGKRQGTVSAIFPGKEGEHANIKAELEYRLTGSNSIFVASTNYDMAFSSSALTLSVDGNTQTISGQPVEMTLNITSNANAPVRDALIKIDYPFGFALTNATPQAAHDNIWEIGDIAPGQKKSITLTGTLKGATGDDRIFHFTAGTRKDPTKKTLDTQLNTTMQKITISNTFLGLAIKVNKSEGTGVVVQPGDIVNVSVSYQNNLSTPVTNAVIVARLSGLQIDGSTVKSTDGFYRSSDSAVLWDKTTTNGALATLAPGAKGTLVFSFQVPPSDMMNGVIDPHLDISINAAGKRVSEAGVPENLQASTENRIAIASDLQVVAQGLYYANPFGSTGPMPPKAGTETTYALVFTITNTTNKISGAVLTATLPTYVRWTGIYSPSSEKIFVKGVGKVAAGDSPCKGSQGDLCWEVGDIEPGAGVNGTPPRQVAISIGLTPSASQIGQQPAMVQNVLFKGSDTTTGGTISRTVIPNVTTNLAQPGKSSQNATVGTDTGFLPANATVVK